MSAEARNREAIPCLNLKNNAMKTIEIKLYQFGELSPEAQKKVIDKHAAINVSDSWWDSTYEDAKNAGLKLTSFDLDRNRHAKGEFILSPAECAEKIITEHGTQCETHKTAKDFISALEALTGQHENIEDVNEDEIEFLEDAFLKSILEDYSIILQEESEYLQSEQAIKETIEANEYDFTEEGNRF